MCVGVMMMCVGGNPYPKRPESTVQLKKGSTRK